MGCRHSTHRHEDSIPSNRPIQTYSHAYGDPEARLASLKSPTIPAAAKIHHVKSNPEMVNMRTADQVLRSPAQVTYPTSDYILSLTRKKKEEAAARANAEAQEIGNDDEDEDEGLEMALRAPREPGQVFYLSPQQFRTLSVRKAEEQTGVKERPQFRAPEHEAANTDNYKDTIASELNSSHVLSTCPSPTSSPPSPSEEGESRGTSYNRPIVVGTPASSLESLRSWHTCQ